MPFGGQLTNSDFLVATLAEELQPPRVTTICIDFGAGGDGAGNAN